MDLIQSHEPLKSSELSPTGGRKRRQQGKTKRSKRNEALVLKMEEDMRKEMQVTSQSSE